MDTLALEAKAAKSDVVTGPMTPARKPKPAKKSKKAVFFEVEILDGKTKEKLLLLDKV